MAFLASEEEEARVAQRFSLLLLSNNETYYEDFSVDAYPRDVADRVAMQRTMRGRLKVCSRSLLFDPKDASQPILKFDLKKCEAICRWEASLMSPMTGDIMVVRTKEFVQMREDNLVTPYKFVKLDEIAEFRFSPRHASLRDLLRKVTELHKAAQGSRFDRDESIDRITQEHHGNLKFNNVWLEDFNERIVYDRVCHRVTPLVRNRGRVVITTDIIYFQPFNNIESEPVSKFRLRDVRDIIQRRFLLRDCGLELHLTDNRRLYFAFDHPSHRAAFCAAAAEQPVLQLEVKDQGNMMLAWQAGKVSNFDYLMFLNNMADRSFNDLAQYPVFPWVIADYTSPHLDLTDPQTFRDLTKPVGALNQRRLQSFRERYEQMPENKFLYGTHYSTPGFVLFYTIRVAPQYALCLQNGKFDHADRLFTSVAQVWRNVNEDAADVKELIPEFYMPGGAFLCNGDRLNLGQTQDGLRVGDVELPPWASSAADFTAKCREALECDYVSENLHHWIDLIFGYKQRGPEAVKADNVFYYLTYEGAVDLEAIDDKAEREGMESQIMEFGQTPKQLFSIPHPQRVTASLPVASVAGAATAVGVEDSAAIAAVLDELHVSDGSQAADVAADEGAGLAVSDSLAPRAGAAVGWGGLVDLEHICTMKIHREGVNFLAMDSEAKTLYSVSQDGTLKLHSIEDQYQMHSVVVGDLALSSVVLLPDKTTVAVSSWDNNVYFYSVEYGRTVDTWPAHDDAICRIIRLGDKLVTASWDTTLKVWDFSQGVTPSIFYDQRLLGDLEGHSCEIQCMDYHDGRGYVVSGDMDGHIIVWDIDSLGMVCEFEDHIETIKALAFCPDGRRVVACAADKCLKVLDIDLGAAVISFETEDELNCLATDGSILVGGGSSGSVFVWDLVNGGTLLKTFSRHKGAVLSLWISPDGTTIISGSADRSICVWTRPDESP